MEHGTLPFHPLSPYNSVKQEKPGSTFSLASWKYIDIIAIDPGGAITNLTALNNDS